LAARYFKGMRDEPASPDLVELRVRYAAVYLCVSGMLVRITSYAEVGQARAAAESRE
jgi:hypothetical protein